jgi:hypothetical protein
MVESHRPDDVSQFQPDCTAQQVRRQPSSPPYQGLLKLKMKMQLNNAA